MTAHPSEPPAQPGLHAIPGGRAAGPAEPPKPKLWRATDLDDSRSIDWLARQRIVAGAVNYMLGKEGIGKSLFLTWLTAKITTGEAFPQFGVPARQPRNVILVLTEDDWATIARPRLELAGADLSRVFLHCEDKDGSGSPTFPDDMPVIAEMAPYAAAVLVDAWADTLPANISVKDPQQARQALHPWKELATRTGITVILSGHTNRDTGSNVRNVYGMTGELRKKARMTILAQPDPDDDGVLVIGPEKSNVAAATPASRFRIESVQVFERTEDSDGTVPRLVWAGDSEHSAREFFVEQAEKADPGDKTEREEAKDWLHQYLVSHGGQAPRQDVLKAATVMRFSERTVKRAMSDLEVESKRGGFGGQATWFLPTGQSGHQSGQRSVRPSKAGPTVSLGLTDDDLHKHDSDLGPTDAVGPQQLQSGQLGQAKNAGPTGGPTGQSTCRVCGGRVGDIHPGCGEITA